MRMRGLTTIRGSIEVFRLYAAKRGSRPLTGVAILSSLAFAAWVPVVRGLSQAQTELARPYGSVGLD
jgi:hypothetical protein